MVSRGSSENYRINLSQADRRTQQDLGSRLIREDRGQTYCYGGGGRDKLRLELIEVLAGKASGRPPTKNLTWVTHRRVLIILLSRKPKGGNLRKTSKGGAIRGKKEYFERRNPRAVLGRKRGGRSALSPLEVRKDPSSRRDN